MDRTQYIFVDYENVRKADLSLVAGKPVFVELILGEQNKTLPLTMVKQMLKHESQVKLIEAGRSGRNALDFVLAYRVGVKAAADAKGYFHIVSRDTGFEALIQHLRMHKIFARRDETFAQAFLTEAPSTPPADRPKLIGERLRKNKTNRPKRKKTLLSQINSYFGKKLAEAELEDLVQTLIKDRLIEIDAKGAVTYRL